MIILGLFLLVVSGCNNSPIVKEVPNQESQLNTKEEAEKTAERFARYWEQRDFDSMYDLFIPELKDMRSKEDFIKFFEASEKASNLVIRLDKLSMDSENVAYIYYTVSSSIYDSKAPAIKLEYIKGYWKVNAFKTFFTEDCAEKCFSFEDCIEECSKQEDFFKEGCLQECFEERCKIDSCSVETDFKCEYNEVENCVCSKELYCPSYTPLCIDGFCSVKQCKLHNDCSSSINPNIKESCESQGLRFYVKPLCSKGKCISSCYELEEDPYFKNIQEERDAKLKMKISSISKSIEINNYDNDLTKVTIWLNRKYKKELDKIDSGTELNVDVSQFVNENGREFANSTTIDSIYLYSQQGKWWD